MNDTIKSRMVQMRYGIIFSLLTLCFGFGLGGAFGAFESTIKDHLKGKAEIVLHDVYSGDQQKLTKVTKKSWVYFKRAHIHANGLAVIAIVLISFMVLLEGNEKMKVFAASSLGVGSLGYSSFWMFAGLSAPGLGSTTMAKESLKYLAIPSAGLCIIGLGVILVIVLQSLFSDRKKLSG